MARATLDYPFVDVDGNVRHGTLRACDDAGVETFETAADAAAALRAAYAAFLCERVERAFALYAHGTVLLRKVDGGALYNTSRKLPKAGERGRFT